MSVTGMCNQDKMFSVRRLYEHGHSREEVYSEKTPQRPNSTLFQKRKALKFWSLLVEDFVGSGRTETAPTIFERKNKKISGSTAARRY